MTTTARYILSALAAFLFTCGSVAQEHTRLTNLPHVYIDTFNGQAVASKTTTVYARMWYVAEDDHVDFYDSLQIRLRGNSTAKLEKKPYKLKFPTKVKLLGKGRANTKKWTLLANHADKTLLRNAITSCMGEFAGLPFNPAAKFVDLTLNGQYVGNYQFSDQVDVRPHRVNVTEQDEPLTDESNVSGGYLLEVDGFRDFRTSASGALAPSGFHTSKMRVPVRIHYPDDDVIAQRQYSFIKTFIDQFEARLFAADFADPLSGYRPLVDSVTLANWYICTEVSANVDGFFSAYFYKEQDDDRLYWGPLWDYDIAYNNDNRTDRGGTNNTERQLMKDYGYGADNGCLAWMQQLWRDPWFARLVNRRFRQLVDAGLEQHLNEKLDSLTALIDASQQLNFQRWSISKRVLRERILYSSYADYVSYVRSFVKHHLAYLADAFQALLPDEPQPEPGVKVPDFVADAQRYYTVANVGTGTCFDVNIPTSELCARQRDEQSHSQQWTIVNLSNGYLFLVNRATGLALSDPSPAGTTATTNTGSVLCLSAPDSADVRQQWDVVGQGDGRYNVVSRWSCHAANLSGGNAADGTPIVSYTSDARDSFSLNRLWRIETCGQVELDAIGRVAVDYALVYDPSAHRLRFAADDVRQLPFTVTIYDQAGRRVATFAPADGYSLAALPAGLYIVAWRHDGRQRTVKLMK